MRERRLNWVSVGVRHASPGIGRGPGMPGPYNLYSVVQ